MGNTFGKIMAYYRQKYDLQQKTIYQGICSGTTFLRAEVNERDVDFIVIETLLGRIGKEAVWFELLLNEEDYGLWMERLAMKAAITDKNYSFIQEKIREYRRKMPGDGKLHEQFCLYYEMKLAEWNGEGKDRVCQFAQSILSYTKESGELPQRQQNLYTPMEMDTLLTLIEYQYEEWAEADKTKECLLELIDYMGIYYTVENREDIEGRAWIELLRISKEYGKEEQLYYIEKAISCFSGANNIRRLAEVHFAKAKLLATMKNATDDRIQYCMEECKMAYSIYEALGLKNEAGRIEKYCMEKLQWHITTQIW